MFYDVKWKDPNSQVHGNSPSVSIWTESRKMLSTSKGPRLPSSDGPTILGGSKENPRPSPAKQAGFCDSRPLEETKLPSSVGYLHPVTPGLSEQQMLDAISRFTMYLEEGRDHYHRVGQPLGHERMANFARFFAPALLTGVRIVELAGRRIANPSFYPEARAMGFANLPDVSHKASVTFLDVVVFNEGITERTLFHGLVHVAQLHVLGIERYVRLFLRGFLRTKSYFLVPIKAHAYALDARFASDPANEFSVEEEVRRWVGEGLY